LFINNRQVSAVLEQGGTVVVPSRQRAAAIRLAHTHAQLGKQLTHWRSCDVLPWSAWLERMAAGARHGALKGLRRLSPGEEWLAWRSAAVEASEDANLLMPASLADALRQSASRVRDGALRWAGSPTSESALFDRVMTLMVRSCQQRAATLSDDWTLPLRDVPASPVPLLFAGFEEMGQALKQRLCALGAAFDEAAECTAETVAGQNTETVVAASDRFDELRLAAQWSREQLEREPAARLLIIVPRLGQSRAMVVQAFDHALNAAELLDGAASGARFVIEGGVPLGDYPLVDAALSLLALGNGGLEFPQLAALLRGSFLGGGAPSARAALELRLRDRNVLSADIPQLLAVVRSAKSEAYDELAATLTAVLLIAPHEMPVRQSADLWARYFAAQLALWHWPGAQALASAEQQQRERFEALLGELAALGPVSGPLSAAGAVELLRSMASRTLFESASDDAAVTISAQCGDPLVHYDGIWVTGLNAEHWPAPAQADPFIPVAVQRAAHMAGASAAGQLALGGRRSAAAAERPAAGATERWGDCAGAAR
jgi:ATP-dependent helicase/nuclease subunit B